MEKSQFYSEVDVINEPKLYNNKKLQLKARAEDVAFNTDETDHEDPQETIVLLVPGPFQSPGVNNFVLAATTPHRES